MYDHSKIVGYLAAAIVLAAFVGWVKFALISNVALFAVFAVAALFFLSWRAASGTWPGNDPKP